jgi:hypothetical protein
VTIAAAALSAVFHLVMQERPRQLALNQSVGCFDDRQELAWPVD